MPLLTTVEAVVESSVKGVPLYLSQGFEVEIEDYRATLPPEFADVQTEAFIWMVRPARI